MDDSARGLMTLLNDILDFSKLEDRERPGRVPSVLGGAVLKAATSPFTRQAEAAGVELGGDVASDVPQMLLGDPYGLRQIISNLTGNAVRFTERGRIAVEARRDGGELIVAVEDTGHGISPDAEAVLFEPFSQGDVSTTRKFGGTGLGLTISRELARALGRDLELTRTGEAGSLFTLRLPCVEGASRVGATPAQETRERRSRFDGVDVLVVDDNPTNRLVLDRLLSRLGATAHLAEGGEEALELLADRPFDLVLMDIMMPGIDGTRPPVDCAGSTCPGVTFRSSRSRLPCSTRIARSLSAGMNDFLEKPVRLDVLEETLLRHCGPATEHQG